MHNLIVLMVFGMDCFSSQHLPSLRQVLEKLTAVAMHYSFFFCAEGAGSPDYIDKNKLTPLVGLQPGPWRSMKLQVDPFSVILQEQTFT